ncbi:MAG: hypothetical protein H6814_09520, partial [Phycisphaeraceae bacterium]|nr:hypothetical protein [Phycisphaeraceae bacterium]
MSMFTRWRSKSPATPSADHTRRSVPATAPYAAPSGQREERIVAVGVEMLSLARGKASLLSSKFWSDKLMDWAMQDHDFKVQLFRFVDAFPTLTTPEMVHDHLVDYLTQPGVKLPPGLGMGLKGGGLAKGLMTSTISGQIKSMASKFIAGTDA